MHMHKCTHTYDCAFMCTNAQAHMRAHAHACAHMHTHACVCAHMHTHAHAHICHDVGPEPAAVVDDDPAAAGRV